MSRSSISMFVRILRRRPLCVRFSYLCVFVKEDSRLPQRQRLRRSAALQARRHNAHRREVFQRRRQRAQPFRLIPIIVSQKNMRHWQNVFEACSFKTSTADGSRPARLRGDCSASEEEMVGTTGFEPATSRTPSVRATRLRYVPTERNCQLTSECPNRHSERSEESALRNFQGNSRFLGPNPPSE